MKIKVKPYTLYGGPLHSIQNKEDKDPKMNLTSVNKFEKYFKNKGLDSIDLNDLDEANIESKK